MFTILINDKKYNAEEGSFLKEFLLEYGMDFLDCDKNHCHDHIITCAALPVTDKDRKILTEKEIASGLRVACDKIVERDLVISCPPCDTVKCSPLPNCNLALSIDEKTVDVGIQNGDYTDSRTIFHDLSSFHSYAEQIEAYQSDRQSYTDSFRLLLKKKCEDLLRCYGLNQAENLAVCTNEFFLRVLFGFPLDVEIKDFSTTIGNETFALPTKKIIVLPPVSTFVSGKLFTRSVKKRDNSLLIDYGKNTTVFYVDKETNTYAYMWETDASPLSLLALRAAVRVLVPEGYKPIVYLYGEYAYQAEEALSEENLTCVHECFDMEDVLKTCLSPALLSKLQKEKQRTSFHDLLKDENFQEELTNIPR